jgi:hypothetical protein
MGDATEADKIMAAALLDDARAHEAGSYAQIASRYDDIYAEILPLEDRITRRVAIALNFWDGWCDASNHEWRYHPGIGGRDWPVLARHIAENLNHGEEATDPRVLQHFSPEALRSRRVKFWDWFAKLWRRSA